MAVTPGKLQENSRKTPETPGKLHLDFRWTPDGLHLEFNWKRGSV
jgi:hypothetical protein